MCFCFVPLQPDWGRWWLGQEESSEGVPGPLLRGHPWLQAGRGALPGHRVHLHLLRADGLQDLRHVHRLCVHDRPEATGPQGKGMATTAAHHHVKCILRFLSFTYSSYFLYSKYKLSNLVVKVCINSCIGHWCQYAMTERCIFLDLSLSSLIFLHLIWVPWCTYVLAFSDLTLIIVWCMFGCSLWYWLICLDVLLRWSRVLRSWRCFTACLMCASTSSLSTSAAIQSSSSLSVSALLHDARVVCVPIVQVSYCKQYW